MPSAYHHGDLPQALVATAAELIDESGPAGFSLREVARRAGVSHAAPAHHFGSARGLLTAVAAEGFRRLTAAMREALGGVDDPAERLAALGRAYVQTAVDNAGYAAVMFRPDLVDSDDDQLLTTGLEAFGLLRATVAEVGDRYNPHLDVELACKLVWSSAQGLVTLHADFGQLDARRPDPQSATGPDELAAMVDGFAQLLLDGFRART